MAFSDTDDVVYDLKCRVEELETEISRLFSIIHRHWPDELSPSPTERRFGNGATIQPRADGFAISYDGTPVLSER